jgi:predicted Zn-dependent peptidase
VQKSQQQNLADEKFRNLMYPYHAYGRYFPTEEMISGYAIDKIKKFYQENFGAKRAHIYVAGMFIHSDASAAISEAFQNWAGGSEPVINIPVQQSERAVYVVDRPGAHQSTLRIGIPVIDPSHEDYVPLQVMNTLLGGFFSSRITRNIREDKGYTYSPSSTISSRYRDAYWMQRADVTTAVTGASLQEIFKEIEGLKNEPPPEEELDGVKKYLGGIFVLQNSSRGGIIGRLAFINLHGLDESYLTNYVKNVNLVTPQQIQEMARKYLKDEEIMLVIAGDYAKIGDQVKPFGKIIR